MSISFGVAWLLLLLLSTLLLLLVWRSDKGARMNGPVCAKCGYEVVRLPTPICPECGADLEKVGVVQRGQRRIVPFILQLAGSAGLILAVFMIVGKTVPLPRRMERSDYTTFVPTDQSQTHSLDIGATRRRWRMLRWGAFPSRSSGPKSQMVTVKFTTADGAKHRVIADLEARSYTLHSPDGPKQRIDKPFDMGAVLAWLRASGLDLPERSLHDQATLVAQAVELRGDSEAIFDLIDNMLSRRRAGGELPALRVTGVGGRSGTSVTPVSDGWVLAGGVLLAVASWGALALLTVRRWRRPMPYLHHPVE